MKSIVEEASSIAKAITTAWERAGKPQSFSVKILQEPVKNFFGLTKKYAKIALFFNGDKNQPSETKESFKQKREERQTDRRSAHRSTNEPRIEQRTEERQRPESMQWTQELAQQAVEAAQGYLATRKLSEVTMRHQVAGSQLSLIFNQPLATEKSKEHPLATSLAYLIMTSLRNHSKSELKGLRILITIEQ